jgi:hypothetical protein
MKPENLYLFRPETRKERGRVQVVIIQAQDPGAAGRKDLQFDVQYEGNFSLPMKLHQSIACISRVDKWCFRSRATALYPRAWRAVINP